ncbi:hypothetical protein E2C01_051871 [Portunus trituberculatus]|uniref:Uncharacterized protein n=1 Tax=Portunus trituberculatus TaxID=210409 RepID=A0A5B7GCY5_PORTR|nr:hypothetical protein [Portunus trituberculatus]
MQREANFLVPAATHLQFYDACLQFCRTIGWSKSTSNFHQKRHNGFGLMERLSKHHFIASDTRK